MKGNRQAPIVKGNRQAPIVSLFLVPMRLWAAIGSHRCYRFLGNEGSLSGAPNKILIQLLKKKYFQLKKNFFVSKPNFIGNITKNVKKKAKFVGKSLENYVI